MLWNVTVVNLNFVTFDVQLLLLVSKTSANIYYRKIPVYCIIASFLVTTALLGFGFSTSQSEAFMVLLIET